MSLSTRALSLSGGNCPHEFEDKHKLGQFTSSQSNLNTGYFDAPRLEKWGGGRHQDYRPPQRTHKINIVDTSCCGCCFHLDCWSFLDFICSLRCLRGRFSQLCTPGQILVISETFFFFFRDESQSTKRSLAPRKKLILF